MRLRTAVAVALLGLSTAVAAQEARVDQYVHDGSGRIIKAIGIDKYGQPLQLEFYYRDDPNIAVNGPYATREIRGSVVGPWLRVSDGQPDPSIPTGPL